MYQLFYHYKRSVVVDFSVFRSSQIFQFDIKFFCNFEYYYFCGFEWTRLKDNLLRANFDILWKKELPIEGMLRLELKS